MKNQGTVAPIMWSLWNKCQMEAVNRRYKAKRQALKELKKMDEMIWTEIK